MRSLIERLRPFSDKLILAVNKVDSPGRDDLVYDYYRFGYERVNSHLLSPWSGYRSS